MNKARLAALVLTAALMGALGMGGCASGSGTGTGTGSGGGTPTSSQPPGNSDTTSLLLLNEQLRSTLGSAYADSWIEGNKLHVAVTTKDAERVVSDAGAIPALVAVNAAQLEAAMTAISRWQAQLPTAQGAAIHKIIPDGRTGTVTIYVAPGQLDAVTAAAARDMPAGKVRLLVKESTGLPTAL